MVPSTPPLRAEATRGTISTVVGSPPDGEDPMRTLPARDGNGQGPRSSLAVTGDEVGRPAQTSRPVLVGQAPPRQRHLT